MSFNSSDDDSQQRFALGFLFAIIALVVSTVVGTVVYKRGIAHAPKASASAAAPAATNVPVVIQEDVASVVVDNGVVKFYFASGKAEVAEGGNAALADVVKGIADGKRAVVSGYHDATGSVEVNQELSKQRAKAVQAALIALGVAEDKVELKKPEQMQASGSNAEARRVEVILAD
ncbi:OmpA family protein [Comamonas testosteroni]|uniref:OmpA family protein n=1 Tax=Comamonas testosteroni TaxID=285 RepID=A0A373FSJ1_COMTE|nr:OmpA family protein [Comamonas testosteroni]RGE47153.1 OmpA family protein [Comamonas testosteroni]